MDDLKELMRLCYNSGLEDVDGFNSWWEELGEDRHDEFVQAGADPVILETLKGLLRTLDTVIETANAKGGDFVEAKNMRWGGAASELIEKLEVDE